MALKKSQVRNPMLTRNGKPRLGPLNIEQLEKLLSSSRKKHVAKINRRIRELKARKSFVEVVATEVSA